MVEYESAYGWGAPRYKSEELAIFDRDLAAVRCGSIDNFRGLSRFTQQAIGWGVATILAANLDLPMTRAVETVLPGEQPKAWEILLALSGGSRAALSDRVKVINAEWTPEVRDLWSLDSLGGPTLPTSYQVPKDRRRR